MKKELLTMLKIRYPDVAEGVLEGLGVMDAVVFDDPYSIVFSTDDQEFTSKSFKTQDQLEKELVSYHAEPESDGWLLHSIYKKNLQLKYDVKIDISNIRLK